MQLSVIIVNYRVRLFLEQCLCSLRTALQGIDAEIWVVDNASDDGSVAYLQPLFPEVKFLPQTTNPGYARANNLALKYCQGDYVLLLNPDTLVPANTISQSLHYMEEHPECGAAGVRMIDGHGRYLPESKRSFPGPWTSFAKLSGLSALFPRSGTINRYAAAELGETSSQPVAVLAGAYILARRPVLEKVGGFNETYFLYGEDIDLSMRMLRAGYENHYMGHLTIIHFKGESMSSLGLKRIYHFYQAMHIFVQDYYPASTARFLNAILLPAIRVRQGIAMLGSLLNPFRYLLADGLLVLTTFWLVQTIWIERIRGGKPFGIPFAGYAILLYTFCVLATAAFAGLYQKKITDKRIYTAAGFALISLLAAYSLLPESLRYSRGVVLIGCVTGIAAMIGWRKIWLKKSGNKMGIISRKESYSAITNLLEQNLFPAAACRYIAPETMFHPGYQLSEQLNADAIGTLVISLSATCRLDQATLLLPALHQRGIRVLWHDENSVGFVGSEPCKPGAQDIAPYCPYQLQNPYQRCMKRLGDLCRSFLFFLCTPYLLLRGAKGRLQLSDAWLVFTGKRCFTGYIQHHPDLPPLKPAIKPHPLRPENKDATSVLLADRQYAANYDWWVDLLHS